MRVDTNRDLSKYYELRRRDWKESIKRKILTGDHARRNKEIYLAKLDGKTARELGAKYNLSAQYIYMICKRYKIFLEDNEMPDFDEKVFDGENGTTTKSELEKAKKSLAIVGKRVFYEMRYILHALPAPSRAKRVLDNAGLNTLAKIDRESDASLLRHPNFGKTSLRQLRRAVAEIKQELGIKGVSDVLRQETKEKIKELVCALGEEHAREALSAMWQQAKDEAKKELHKELEKMMKNIAPSETPFLNTGPRKELNLYEWKTNDTH